MTSTVRAGLIGAGAGAATMFLLDPDHGPRRRALVRDKGVRLAHKTGDAADAARRDIANRLKGLQARTIRHISDDASDDQTVRERVRAALGRLTAHPRAICVDVREGKVTLTGDVLASESSAVASAIEHVRGVREVDNNLAVHTSAASVPSLQGGSSGDDAGRAWLRRRWSPTALATASIATGALAIAAAAARGRNEIAADAAEPDATDAGGVLVDVITIEPLG